LFVGFIVGMQFAGSFLTVMSARPSVQAIHTYDSALQVAIITKINLFTTVRAAALIFEPFTTTVDALDIIVVFEIGWLEFVT
jgi:hypothetical protein